MKGVLRDGGLEELPYEALWEAISIGAQDHLHPGFQFYVVLVRGKN